MLAEDVARYEDLPKRLELMAAELRRLNGVSKRAMSLAAGQSKEFVNTIINGRSTDPGAISLARMCEKYGYNVRWLLTGLGERTINRTDDLHAARERGEVPRSESGPDTTDAEPTAKPSLSRLKPAPQTPIVKPTKRARG